MCNPIVVEILHNLLLYLMRDNAATREIQNEVAGLVLIETERNALTTGRGDVHGVLLRSASRQR